LGWGGGGDLKFPDIYIRICKLKQDGVFRYILIFLGKGGSFMVLSAVDKRRLRRRKGWREKGKVTEEGRLEGKGKGYGGGKVGGIRERLRRREGWRYEEKVAEEGRLEV
jgi:hypothetical protein